jgi:hypothetical protein
VKNEFWIFIFLGNVIVKSMARRKRVFIGVLSRDNRQTKLAVYFFENKLFGCMVQPILVVPEGDYLLGMSLL